MSELHQHFLQTLMKTQHLLPARLHAYQDRLTRDLLLHAVSHVPAYRDGARAAAIRTAIADPAAFASIPPLVKQEARELGAALHSEILPAACGEQRELRTSGTTGSPFAFQTCASAVLASQCCGERFLLWHGIGPDEILAQMDVENRGRIDHRETLDLSTPPPVGRRRLCFDIGLPGHDAHSWLWSARVRHAVIMPSFARAMAHDILSGRKPALSLDTVICYGEGLDDETRRDIRSAFGARVLNRYACEETGAIGLECPAGGLHVQSEIVRVEILDDDGRPVPPGVEGRVALTALYNYAMPLIRYVIGDRATLLPEACSCGCTLPLISPVIGRQRHVFRFADGSQVWPSITPSVLRRHLPFRQMRFLQRALDSIEMLYVPEGDATPDFEAARAFILSRLVPDLQITFTAVDEIPRLPGGKYLDYMSLIDPAQT